MVFIYVSVLYGAVCFFYFGLFYCFLIYHVFIVLFFETAWVLWFVYFVIKCSFFDLFVFTLGILCAINNLPHVVH
ncbi:hypothetical protein N483_01410 [Pseudoalteromonas luteoviolacea NCIMB 1944]|nr:hypothetical protein N483_01410 [Pseudoalteromonas luteoviolacea NCIMB 1944]